MKGVVYLGEGAVAIRECAMPDVGPGQVLIEMKAAGLCGSDLHKYHMSCDWAMERNGMIAGHEPSGVVAALGSGVTHLAVGDRVCVYHSLGCGHCATCLAGEPVFCDQEGAFGRTCDGCHADFMVSDARYCLPLPDDFSFAVGAMLACTAGTAFAAVQKTGLVSGDTFVVFGLGPVGLTVLLMGKAMGFRCLGVDVSAYRLRLAERLCDAVIVNGKETDVVDAVATWTQGKGALGVVECSGSHVARSQTTAVAACHATIVIVGAGADEIVLNPTDVLRKSLTLRGNAVYSMQAYFDAVAFLQTHSVPLEEMVTHRFGIDQASEAFALFDKGETGKVVFDWDMS